MARSLAGVVSAALLAGSLAGLAVSPAVAYADTTTDSSTGLPVASPDAVALAQAEATGQSVAVTADNTANSSTAANPDGSYTFTDSVVPTQVQQNGSWVPVDATLHTNSDGTLTPNAVESSVVFSGGGTSPLVTLASPSGQQVSLSWPSTLPAPTVSGDTATYADVYPGVNLVMTATVYGGYSEQLVITNATAAANPALADIHFNTSTTGLTLSDNTVGGLQATDTAGNAVFTSPTATMWSTPPATGGDTTQVTKSLAVKSQDTTVTTPAAGDADATTNLGLDVTSDGVDLIPPAGALTSPSNTYPLVIDPTLTPAATLNAWGWVSQTDSGTSYWEGGNNTHDDDAHVGYDDWCPDNPNVGGCASSAFGVTRTLLSFDMTKLAGKNVTAASLVTDEQGPTSSTSGNRQIDLHGAGGSISDTTTWNNQPAAWATSYPGTFPTVNSDGIDSGNFKDITSLIQNAVTQGYNSQTMVLEADNESDDTAYRYLIGKGTPPVLTVTYWSTPDAPTSLNTTNGAGPAVSCATTAPGPWIGASDSGTINLNASLSSPDVGYSENSDFWIRETEPTEPAHWTDLGGPTIVTAAKATPTSVPTPTLQDGAQYQWSVYAQNGGGFSSVGAPVGYPNGCYFQTDFTPPSAPVVSNPTLPTASGGSGQLTVTATDAGSNPSGVAKFLYNMNGTSLTAGGGGETTVTSTGTATIQLQADNWGTNTIWIASVDKAGNQSQPIHYDFYVAPSAYTPGTSGDLDGDGKSDLAFVDTAGNIRLYSDPLDTTGTTPPTTSLTPTTSQPAGGQILLHASQAPNGSSFSGSLIAHNGSFSGQTCDDLAIIQGGSLHIATENNDCQPTDGWTLYPGSVGRPNNHVLGGDTTHYNNTDWSSVQQAVLIPSGSNSVSPTLITQEDDNNVPTLWMTTFAGPNPQSITLLATGSYWGTVTIMSPGLIGGQPALWVRDNTTGSLTQYTNIETWLAATTPTTGPTGGTQIAASGYNTTQYPMISTNGADATGTGPTLWAVDPTGRLNYIPTTLDSSNNPSIPTTGAAPVTSTGWADNIQNLGTVAVPNAPTSQGNVWPLGSTAGGNDIGAANPATSTGTISYTTGADGTPNGATVFDGSTTALTTTAPTVDTSQSYSVSAWVNLNATNVNSVFVAQGNSPTDPADDGLQLYYSATSGSYAFGRHTTNASGAAFDAVYSPTSATTGTWSHLVGVFDATANTLTLYVNGTQAVTGPYTGTAWPATGPVQIGSEAPGNQNANAAIDQVAIYSQALSAQQVAYLNNA